MSENVQRNLSDEILNSFFRKLETDSKVDKEVILRLQLLFESSSNPTRQALEDAMFFSSPLE